MSRLGSAILLAALPLLVACSQTEREPLYPGLAIARFDEVPPGGALYSDSHELYLVDAGEEGLIALSQRDPFRGCKVQYLAEGEDLEGFRLEPATRFVDPCHGGQYDLAGRVLAGPSEENLRRIAIEVVGGVAYVDPNPARDT